VAAPTGAAQCIVAAPIVAVLTGAARFVVAAFIVADLFRFS